MTEHDTQLQRSGITGRRGFVAAASLSILSLYGLWSGYGTAPSLSLGGAHDDGAAPADGHGGHGGHGAAGGDPGAFRAEAESFIERYRLPDGSVQPPAITGSAFQEMEMPMSNHGGHHGHVEAGMASPAPAHGAGEAPLPADIYLLVQQWLFEPALLRLAAGVPYRLRMLALDVSHGASLQLGLGSRIIRLRPGTPSDLLVRFERPGEVLLYCTVYCGLGHDQMHGRIIVT